MSARLIKVGQVWLRPDLVTHVSPDARDEPGGGARVVWSLGPGSAASEWDPRPLDEVAAVIEAAVAHRDVKPASALAQAEEDLRRVVQAGEGLARWVDSRARRPLLPGDRIGEGQELLGAWREAVGPGPRAAVVGGPELVPPGGGA